MTLTKALFNAVDKAVKAIPSFIDTEEEDGKKVKIFKYGSFTVWCDQTFSENVHLNTSESISRVVRDLAMERYDHKYNSNKNPTTYKLRGMFTYSH